jgi:thioredoxin 1
MNHVMAIQSADFENLIEQHDIVFLDFWAPWCAPCLHFSKVYEQIAQDFKQITFAQLNIEESPELPQSFEIQSIPYLMVIKQGVVIFAESGSMPASRLKELAEQAILVNLEKK